eukprot:gene7819-1018_t
MGKPGKKNKAGKKAKRVALENPDHPYVGLKCMAYSMDIFTWYLAMIIDAKEDKVKIRWQGWLAEWDEWIDVKSDRFDSEKGGSKKWRPVGPQFPGAFERLMPNTVPKGDQKTRSLGLRLNERGGSKKWRPVGPQFPGAFERLKPNTVHKGDQLEHSMIEELVRQRGLQSGTLKSKQGCPSTGLQSSHPTPFASPAIVTLPCNSAIIGSQAQSLSSHALPSPAIDTLSYGSPAIDTQAQSSHALPSPAIDTQPCDSLAIDTQPCDSPAIDTQAQALLKPSASPANGPAIDSQAQALVNQHVIPRPSPALPLTPYHVAALLLTPKHRHCHPTPFASPAIDTLPCGSPAIDTQAQALVSQHVTPRPSPALPLTRFHAGALPLTPKLRHCHPTPFASPAIDTLPCGSPAVETQAQALVNQHGGLKAAMAAAASRKIHPLRPPQDPPSILDFSEKNVLNNMALSRKSLSKRPIRQGGHEKAQANAKHCRLVFVSSSFGEARTSVAKGVLLRTAPGPIMATGAYPHRPPPTCTRPLPPGLTLPSPGPARVGPRHTDYSPGFRWGPVGAKRRKVAPPGKAQVASVGLGYAGAARSTKGRVGRPPRPATRPETGQQVAGKVERRKESKGRFTSSETLVFGHACLEGILDLPDQVIEAILLEAQNGRSLGLAGAPCTGLFATPNGDMSREAVQRQKLLVADLLILSANQQRDMRRAVQLLQQPTDHGNSNGSMQACNVIQSLQ